MTRRKLNRMGGTECQYQNTLNTITCHASCTQIKELIGTRKVAMLLFAAVILCLLGFLQSFGTSQYRSTDGRVVDAKDSGNQPADSKARCLLTCGFHRMDYNSMDSNGAFKVSKSI